MVLLLVREMTVTVTQEGLIKLECCQCGAEVWRKIRRDNLTCADCKRENNRRNYRLYNRVKRNGKPAHRQTECNGCKYLPICRRVLWNVKMTRDGLKYTPLRCFAEHPRYDATEWGRHGLQAQDGR